MRIYIVSMEEPFYLPRFFERVVTGLRDDIVGISILRRFPRGKGFFHYVHEQLLLFGPREFLQFAFYYWWYRLRDILIPPQKTTKVYSIKRLAEKYNIPYRYEYDLNDPAFTGYLRRMGVDILITQVSQILKRGVLSAPRWGCINKHASILPQFRGLYPVYWAMALQAGRAGVTVHRMSEEIDGGTVLAQTPITIGPGDTVTSLYNRVFGEGARLMVESIEKIKDGEQPPFSIVENVTSNGYFSFPDRSARKKFREAHARFGHPRTIRLETMRYSSEKTQAVLETRRSQ